MQEPRFEAGIRRLEETAHELTSFAVVNEGGILYPPAQGTLTG
jgi:hypothetical protein